MNDIAPMAATALRFGIPDIELSCASGATVNPSSFAGHELVVLFCPADPAEAAREISSYRSRCADFVDYDAWVLAIGEECAHAEPQGPDRILTIKDPQRGAWEAFRGLTDLKEAFDEKSGATFFFTRGGNLHRSWPGPGHLQDVLSELRSPTA